MFGEPKEQEIILETAATYTAKQEIVKPRPAQLLALEALAQTREEDYDKALVVLEEMKKKRSPRKQQLVDAYVKIKTDLSMRPTHIDYHLKAGADARAIKQEFGSYLGLLAYAAEISEIEQDAFVEMEWLVKRVNYF